MIQEDDTNQSQGTDQIEESTKNLSCNTDDDQIQLNSIEFNGNQWISVEINEHQLNSMEFNKNQLISTDINRFQLISTDITGNQQEDDWVV